MSDRPNIILITPDQFHAGALGCAGNPIVRTPHLDALAARGIRFAECHNHSVVCTPSRATIVTGAHPSVTGSVFNDMAADLRLPSVAGVLAEQGYRTGHVGKWHQFPRDERFGFETVWAHTGYREFLAEHGWDPELGDEYAGDWTHDHATWESPLPAELSITEYETTRAIEYVGLDDERPFFLWLSYEKPHLPFNPPAPYSTMYDPAAIPLPDRWHEGPPDDQVPHKRAESIRHWRTGMTPDAMTDDDIRRAIAYYYGSVSLVDHGIGRLVEHLRDRGLLEDTLIVVSSDHGEMLGQQRLLNKGAYPYDALTRVPLIVSGPGIAGPGAVEGRIVGQEDVLATIVRAGGGELPPTMAGRDLLAAVQEDGPIVPGVSAELFGPLYDVMVWSWRTQRHRLTEYRYQDGRALTELFDLAEDPGETRNLAGVPESADVEASMRAGLLGDVVRRGLNGAAVVEIAERFSDEGTRRVTAGW
jgi:arylsulfatase A-like enzyme